ncbi:DUF4232 domain-containing protein [Streptomyces sp. NPDC006923]|uniref:DUF4232 domain-containing protein n=1 Tax=Streptomyces sp. NPDC006923 TaxID=3155355 RepID=UPI0033DEF4E0
MSARGAGGSRPPKAGRTRRAATLAAAVALLAAATAACGSDGSAAPGPGSTSLAGSSSATAGDGTSHTPGAPPSPATSGPSSGSGDGRPVASASPRCTADRLGLSLGDPDVGAGNIRYDLRLTNKGPEACTLLGFPGVSLLAGDGATIGEPATREGGRLKTVKLTPGASAHTTLHTLNKGIKGSACWPAPSLLKIYPPGSRDALTLRASAPVVCGDTFTVTAIRPS